MGHFNHFANSKFGDENWLESRRHSKQPSLFGHFGSLLSMKNLRFQHISFFYRSAFKNCHSLLNAVQVVQLNVFWKITFDVKYWKYNRIFDLLSESTITQISSFEMFACVIYWFLPSNSILPGGLLSSVWFYPKIYYHSNDYFYQIYFQPECNWYHVRLINKYFFIWILLFSSCS